MERVIKVQTEGANDDAPPKELPMKCFNEGADETEDVTDNCCSEGQDSGGHKSTVAKVIKKLRYIRGKYSSSFTLHALPHIVEGTPREKIFWTVKLLSAIGVALYLCWDLFLAYFSHEVDSKLQVVLSNGAQFPTLHICRNEYKHYLHSYNDCSSKMSKSYDEDICTSLNQRCPPFFTNSEHDSGKEGCEDGHVSCETCGHEMLGQCIAVNEDGTFVQTVMTNEMSYVQDINASSLPVELFLNHPGKAALAGTGFYRKRITDYGMYIFIIEKTTFRRLPYPYSNPSCVVQGSAEASSKNMFLGPYTVKKCKTTCWTKLDLKCGTTRNNRRVQVKDQAALKKLLTDKNISEFEECLRLDWKYGGSDVAVKECIANCSLPCEEDVYRVSDFYEPSSTKQINLLFKFNDVGETNIVEVPSFGATTLLANFGGTMGLMTGMSAISVLELLIWLILFLIDRIYLLYKKLVIRSVSHDSMV